MNSFLKQYEVLNALFTCKLFHGKYDVAMLQQSFKTNLLQTLVSAVSWSVFKVCIGIG